MLLITMTIIVVGWGLWQHSYYQKMVLAEGPASSLTTSKAALPISKLSVNKQRLEVESFIKHHSAKRGMDWIDPQGATHLVRAISNHCIACTSLLLKAGADANFAPAPHMAPLLIATSAGEIELVSMLLKHGANPNLKFNGENYTLLMDAAFEGNQKVVEQLLKYGALIDQQDREGMSALHYASREGFTKVVELLIKKGADRHLTNLKEETPLGLARRYQHLAVIDLLD